MHFATSFTATGTRMPYSVTCHPAELTFPPTRKHSGGQQHSFIRSFLLHAHMYMLWIIKQRSTRRRAPALQMSLHCDVTLTHLHCDLLTCCHSPLPLSVCLSVRLSSLQPVSSRCLYLPLLFDASRTPCQPPPCDRHKLTQTREACVGRHARTDRRTGRKRNAAAAHCRGGRGHETRSYDFSRTMNE